MFATCADHLLRSAAGSTAAVRFIRGRRCYIWASRFSSPSGEYCSCTALFGVLPKLKPAPLGRSTTRRRFLGAYNTRAAQPGATERGATSAVCVRSPPLPRAASRVTRDSGAPGTLHPPWTAALDPPGATCERPVTPPRLSARRRPSWLWARVLTASAGPPPPVMCAPCVSPLAIAPDHHRSPGAAVTRWE